jgi:hypothetical protein
VINSVFWILLAYLLIFSMGWVFDKVPGMECNNASGGDSACFGLSSMIRMSFTLFVFHIIILASLVPRMTCSAAFHDGCWCFKVLLIFVIFFMTFFIPNSFFKGYAQMARVLSFFFMICQMFMVVITAYILNDLFVNSYNSSQNANESSGRASVLIGGTVFFTVGSVVWLVF